MSSHRVRRWVLPVLAILIVGGLWLVGSHIDSTRDNVPPGIPATNPDLLEQALRAAPDGDRLSEDWTEALAELRNATSQPTQPSQNLFGDAIAVRIITTCIARAVS